MSFQPLAFQPAFQQSGGIVADEGGRPRRRKEHKRRRLFVEIDGQSFSVRSEAEALQLLQHAKALAEKQAEQKTDVVVRKLKSKERVPEVRIQAPEITVSPDFTVAASSVIAEIEGIYQRAAQRAELRLLIARREQQELDDDDEDVLLLL